MEELRSKVCLCITAWILCLGSLKCLNADADMLLQLASFDLQPLAKAGDQVIFTQGAQAGNSCFAICQAKLLRSLHINAVEKKYIGHCSLDLATCTSGWLCTVLTVLVTPGATFKPVEDYCSTACANQGLDQQSETRSSQAQQVWQHPPAAMRSCQKCFKAHRTSWRVICKRLCCCAASQSHWKTGRYF